MKKQKNKKIHILLIIIGTIFIALSAFNSNIWFDESYSVAISVHKIIDIWAIGANDVHPVLYYIILHILNSIFGTNIIIYRFFSIMGIVVLGILGYTHIRKLFGEKVGLIFSYLSFFLPVMCVYAIEIRMYSWAITLVTLTAIYAYKTVKENTKKNWIIFAICSLSSAYTHYYGLITVTLINIYLLIYIIKNKRSEKTYIRNYLIQAAIEIILYIPWIINFIGQIMYVKNEFWITLKLPDSIIEMLSFQYKGILDKNFTLNTEIIVTLIFAIFLYTYIGHIIYIEKKNKKNINAGLVSIGIYSGVIIFIIIISNFVTVFYSRYLFVMTGLLIFTLAFFLAREKRKSVLIGILSIITIMSIYNETKLITQNYNISNMKQIEYIQKNIQPNDIIVYSDIGTGSVIAVNFPNNKQYFLNLGKWNVEEAYKAYSPQMETVFDYEFLDNYSGKIWIIDSEDTEILNDIKDGNTKIILDTKKIETKYHDYIFNITLIEKI